ncbi:MAG: SCO family protein [Chloroflexi bacterium]|nr:MAG: SCO family protein [Chloroflexota bacterium]PIE80942.1 MAG: SCO family protein [Chloroflexota bacterium]
MATISEQPEIQTEKRPLRIILIIAGGVIAGLALGWLLLQWLMPPSYNGQVIDSQTPLTNFTLTGADGEPTSLIDFRGKVVMLYYGYTFCPDVCPATMAELKTAVQELGRAAEDVQVIMISLDPERDTPEVLEKYVTHFHPSFIGLTGSEDEIVAASAPLGIFYEREQGSAATGYLINHTATVMVLDKNGYLRLLYHFGTPGEDMASDLKTLVRE